MLHTQRTQHTRRAQPVQRVASRSALLKMTLRSVCVLIALGLSVHVSAQPTPLAPPVLQELPRLKSAHHLEAYQRLFSLPSGQISQLFADSFLKLVPASVLLDLQRQYKGMLGELRSVEPAGSLTIGSGSAGAETRGPDAPLGVYKLVFERGHAPSKIHLDSEGLIDTVWFGAPVKTGGSYAEALKDLAALRGVTSAVVMDERGAVIAAHNPDSPLAVGSSFKLYILRALELQVKQGRRSYSDVVQLKEQIKSIPSGFLQTWPAGSPVTLDTLSKLMISISDNTATDHLLSILGRAEVEAVAPKTMRPLLSTREMFQLKINPRAAKLRARYLKGDLKQKRAALKSLKSLSLEGLKPFTKPTLIKEIEWHASTRALCGVIRALGFHEALTINPGLLNGDMGEWSKVAYKGGSEPGVLNYTQLLQTQSENGKTPRVYCVSASINDSNQEVDTERFTTLTRQLISLTAQRR